MLFFISSTLIRQLAKLQLRISHPSSCSQIFFSFLPFLCLQLYISCCKYCSSSLTAATLSRSIRQFLSLSSLVFFLSYIKELSL